MAQLELSDLVLIEGRPEYMRISTVLYVLGLAYERTVNRFPTLSRFRVLIMATMTKPPG
jgi:hypothetical protein